MIIGQLCEVVTFSLAWKVHKEEKKLENIDRGGRKYEQFSGYWNPCNIAMETCPKIQGFMGIRRQKLSPDS